MFGLGDSFGRAIRLVVVWAAVGLFTGSAQAAELEVSDLFVTYGNQTDTTATGRVTFNLRFVSLGGDPATGYDLFSSQVLLSRITPGPLAKFHLDEAVSEDTASIGGDYWLPVAPTFFQNASTVGGQFRFTDFVSVSQSHVPMAGDIVASFAIDFDATSADQIGEYSIGIGDSSANYFNSDFVNRYNTTIDGATFSIEAAPEPATCLLLLAPFALLRRRRI